jgi:hypothetical protein
MHSCFQCDRRFSTAISLRRHYSTYSIDNMAPVNQNRLKREIGTDSTIKTESEPEVGPKPPDITREIISTEKKLPSLSNTPSVDVPLEKEHLNHILRTIRLAKSRKLVLSKRKLRALLEDMRIPSDKLTCRRKKSKTERKEHQSNTK